MSEKLNRQTLRSRKMLSAALLELLNEKPLAKISISEITEKADLSRSTFYTNFESKEELLDCYIDDIVTAVFNGILIEDFSDSGWAGKKIGVQFIQEFASRPELAPLFKSPEIGHLIIQRIKMQHHKLYDDELSKVPGFNPVLANYFIEYITYTTFALLNHWILTGMNQSPEVIGQLIDEFLLPVGSLDVINRFNGLIN